MDISPWIADQAGWFGNFNMNDFTYLNTSGGGKRADSEFITHDNITRWRDVHRITGKKIIADCGYGVAGASTGHDNAWDNPANIRARMADGVIAVHQANPRSDWDAILATLKPQLQ